MLPVAVIKPAVAMFPPVTLPLALKTPVIYSPVVANTATLLVPPMLTVTLLLAMTVTFELPLLMLAKLVTTPVKQAPLPMK